MSSNGEAYARLAEIEVRLQGIDEFLSDVAEDLQRAVVQAEDRIALAEAGSHEMLRVVWKEMDLIWQAIGDAWDLIGDEVTDESEPDLDLDEVRMVAEVAADMGGEVYEAYATVRDVIESISVGLGEGAVPPELHAALEALSEADLYLPELLFEQVFGSEQSLAALYEAEDAIEAEYELWRNRWVDAYESEHEWDEDGVIVDAEFDSEEVWV